MAMQPTIIERAYQLARGGKCRTMDDIASMLHAERYDAVPQHLAGTGIRKELNALMHAAN